MTPELETALADLDLRAMPTRGSRYTAWHPARRACGACSTAQPTAPIFMFSSQALWSSMTFANEAAMLRAFIITYDEIGWMTRRRASRRCFVDWMIEPPRSHVTLQQLAAHEKAQSYDGAHQFDASVLGQRSHAVLLAGRARRVAADR